LTLLDETIRVQGRWIRIERMDDLVETMFFGE
jgi:hypothetical protein